MKKLLSLFTFLIIILSSCSSDDSDGLAINSQNLLGKWYLKGGTTNNGSFENHTHDCTTNKDFQEFFNNGEITFNGYNTECSLDEIETSLWFLNGNRLTVTNTNFDPMIYEYEYIIESLTSDELILKETVSEPEGTFVYRSTFTRN